jgi:hypothetical protein
MVDRSICARPCLAGCVDKNSSPLSGRESLPTVLCSFWGPKKGAFGVRKAGPAYVYLRATATRTHTVGRQSTWSKSGSFLTVNPSRMCLL